jgi:hypothetical protein
VKLLPLYESILSFADMSVTSDGYVSRKNDGDPIPAVTKSRRLVLPTAQYLSNPKSKECIVFHPLSENVLEGESEILEFLRSSINIRLNTALLMIMCDMLVIASSQAMHKSLTPDQSAFLSSVTNANEKTLDVFVKLVAAVAHDGTGQTAVHIYLKKRGMIKGKQFMRAGIVSFPLYEELVKLKTEKAPLTCWGVKLTAKDRDTLLALFEFLLPGIDVTGSYNRGSSSDVAPFLDALMQAALTIAGPINDIVEMFGDKIKESESLHFDNLWVETFDNLDTMIPEIRLIPMQGSAVAATPVTAVPVPVAPVAVVPVWQQTGQFYQPQPQVQQPPAAGIVRTSAGLDFDSILRSVPGVAGHQPNAQHMPNVAPPRWANPGYNVQGTNGQFNSFTNNSGFNASGQFNGGGLNRNM